MHDQNAGYYIIRDDGAILSRQFTSEDEDIILRLANFYEEVKNWKVKITYMQPCAHSCARSILALKKYNADISSVS